MDPRLTAQSLRDTGLAVAGALLPGQVAEVNAYLESLPVWPDCHVMHTALERGVVSPVPRGTLTGECMCVGHQDALLAPHLLERALALSPAAAEYLEVPEPVIYSANAFWTRPGTEPPRWDIQELHRDADDERFLAMFVYLADVREEADGPHVLRGPDGEDRFIFGPAGTVFLADTRHEHAGLKPRSRERGLAWFRWGISEHPPAYVWDGIAPVPWSALGDRYPSSPTQRRQLRLLVSPPPP